MGFLQIKAVGKRVRHALMTNVFCRKSEGSSCCFF